MFADLFKFLGGLAVMGVVLYAASRFVGLGTCMRCGRPIPPWNAYCYRESCEVSDA